jgi:hypothetical protein
MNLIQAGIDRDADTRVPSLTEGVITLVQQTKNHAERPQIIQYSATD